MVQNREGISLDDITKEIDEWNRHFFVYHQFVMGLDVPSFRLDEETSPIMMELRRRRKEILQVILTLAPQVKIHLKACRKTPTLCRILEQNSDLNPLELARIVYGDTSGMYVNPPKV